MRRLGFVVLLALLLPLLTPPPGGAVTPDRVATADRAQRSGPDFHKPKVGECHDLTFKQAAAVSDSRAPVPCTGRTPRARSRS